jgi:hypothetical protein
MDWSEAEALYALQSIRKDADHPVGGRIAFERKADTAGAEHQSKYFLQMVSAVSGRRLRCIGQSVSAAQAVLECDTTLGKAACG